MIKKTKIVATISDLRCDIDFIRKLYDAGMDVVRLNTAHQSIDATGKIIDNIRQVSDTIALMLDTKGPEIRTTTSDYKIALKRGDYVKLAGDECNPSTPDCIYVSYNNFINEVNENDHILIDDGEIELKIIEKKDDILICEALNDGLIKGRKSVNVPNTNFALPALSEKDKEYIEFAIDQDIDFIAHSFVRSKEDVIEIQNRLDKRQSKIKIIAKIENQEGVDNIDEILACVYGIMVARGDLAIEIPYEKIPGIQKMLINKCINARKPVIIATQMLHSMIDNPRPTRAEVTDVANAIYSKTDAIMLSGETAFGCYPVEAVQAMSRIAQEVEKSRSDIHKTPLVILSTHTSAYLTKSAVEASIELNAEAIVADTTTGRTVRNIAGYRGKKVIYAQCYNKRIVRELSLSFGVYPFYLNISDTKPLSKEALSLLLEKGFLRKEDMVVIVGGNFGQTHGASHIEIIRVETLLSLG